MGRRSPRALAAGGNCVQTMTKNILFILICCLISAAYGEEVSLRDGAVRFITPDGFMALTQPQIKVKYPNYNRPQVVYANSDQGVSIAVTFSSARVRPEQIPELKTMMEQTLPRVVPNLEWIKREIITTNNTDWVHLEFTSSAIDTDIHNHMYLTSFDGRMLGFNFNATRNQYHEYAQILEASFRTIRIGSQAANQSVQPDQPSAGR